jgi:hypothetical protein
MSNASCVVYVAQMRHGYDDRGYLDTDASYKPMEVKPENLVSSFVPGCRIWAVPPEIVKASDEGSIATAIIRGILASPSLPTGPATLGDNLVAGRFYIAF